MRYGYTVTGRFDSATSRSYIDIETMVQYFTGQNVQHVHDEIMVYESDSLSRMHRRGVPVFDVPVFDVPDCPAKPRKQWELLNTGDWDNNRGRKIYGSTVRREGQTVLRPQRHRRRRREAK